MVMNFVKKYVGTLLVGMLVLIGSVGVGGSTAYAMSADNGDSQQGMRAAVYRLVGGSHRWWCDNGVLGNRTYPFSELGGDVGYVVYVYSDADSALFRRSDHGGSYLLHREADGCVYLDSLDSDGSMSVQYMRVR